MKKLLLAATGVLLSVVSGCATSSRTVSEGPVAPGYLGHWTDTHSSPSGDDFDKQIRRAVADPAGLPFERVTAMPTVPFTLAFQAVGALGDSRGSATDRDKLFMYSVLETAYAGKRSCFTISAARKGQAPFDGSQWVLYVEDADQHFSRLAAADVLEQDDEASAVRSLYEGYGGSYCTASHVDFMRPFNLFVGSASEPRALTRLSWFPVGGQALATTAAGASKAIADDLRAHPDFKISMRRVDPQAMEAWAARIRAGDHKQVLKTIDFGPDDETLGDRYSLGALAILEAERGHACDGDFILKLVPKGALLSPLLLKRATATAIEECPTLDLVRFDQIPADREAAFGRIHQAFLDALKTRMLGNDNGDKHANAPVTAMVGIESMVVKNLKDLCSGDKSAGAAKSCAMHARAVGDVLRMRATFKAGIKEQKSARVRARLRLILKLLEPVRV